MTTGAPISTVAVPAGWLDVEPLSDTLQAAFWDDPVLAWLLPDESSRSRRLANLFGVLLRTHYLSMRTVWTTPDQMGAALWAPPGHWRLPLLDVVRAAPVLALTLGRRAIPGRAFLDEIDRRHPAEPHWYLGVLGTSPDHQGSGIGSTLLQPVLAHCDREGLPCYLESSKDSNIAFYARHGFVVTEEISAVDAPTVWPMWREPRPRDQT